MTVVAAPKGFRGFDCNFPLSRDQISAMRGKKNRYVLRYVPRTRQAPHDVTREEVLRIIGGGLAIMPVQHVENENWHPDPMKGEAYGANAARFASLAGIRPGTNLWLDLEGVAPGTDSETIIRFCNRWHDQCFAGGFLPGLYVGWHCGLNPDQLYRRLKFTRYWSAYNLNADEAPAVVGSCMRQMEASADDYPAGWDRVANQIDTNVVLGDAKNRFPMVYAPAEWG